MNPYTLTTILAQLFQNMFLKLAVNFAGQAEFCIYHYNSYILHTHKMSYQTMKESCRKKIVLKNCLGIVTIFEIVILQTGIETELF